MNLPKLIIWGVLFALPFIFKIEALEQFRQPKEDFMIMMAFFAVANIYFKRVSWISGVLICYVAVNQYLGVFSTQDSSALPLLAALLVALVFITDDRKLVERYQRHMVTFMVIPAVWGIAQCFKLIPPDIMYYVPGAEVRPTFFFGQQTLYGPIAVAAFIMALYQRRWIFALILFVPIPLIDSSFTYLALAVGLVCFLIDWKSWLISPFIIISILIGITALWLYDPGAPILNDNGRFTVWRHTLYLSQGAPVMGRGLGAFKNFYYPIIQDKNLRKLNGVKDDTLTPESKKITIEAENLLTTSGKFLSAHSEPIEILFELGIVGLILALSVLAHVIYMKVSIPLGPVENSLFAVFFVFAANSIGNFIFHLSPQGLYPLICYVLLASWSKIKPCRKKTY